MRSPRMVNPAGTKSIKLIPTRSEFAQMELGEIEAGMTIRSLSFVKWTVEEVGNRDVTSLPSYNRTAIAKYAESDLPPEFVVKHAKKPVFIIREIDYVSH